METEFVSSHVEGTRVFVLDPKKLLLRSWSMDHIWLPGVIEVSQCRIAKGHKDLKPEPDCTCGIWSCKSRKQLHKIFAPHVPSTRRTRRYSSQFLGDFFNIYIPWMPTVFSARVEQWGVIIEHQFGYRSEFARIIPQSIQVYPRPQTPQYNKLVKFLRNKYGGR